ncbi:MAG: right-handed parallel beta-helix repeat-containing protein, partial [Bacteroidota bacterium]
TLSELNKNLTDARLSQVSRDPVLSQVLATPPGSPSLGDRYLVPPGATGAWAGQDGNLTEWDGTAWQFFPPQTGWQIWVIDETAAFFWSGSAWVGIEENQLFDAVVSVAGSGFTSLTSALAAGNKSIFVKSGTYIETSSAIVESGVRIFGEDTGGGVTLQFTSANGVVLSAGDNFESGGTISVATNSVTVTGAGTTFTNLDPGDFILIGINYYEIATINSNTNLSLSVAFEGQSQSGLSYVAQTMVSDVEITNIKIRGASGTGLQIQNTRSSTFEKLHVDQCNQNISLTDCGDLILDKVTSSNGTLSGLLVNGCYGVRMELSRINNNGLDGILFQGTGRSFHLGATFFNSNDGDGVDVQGTWRDIFITDLSSYANDGKGINTEPSTGRVSISGGDIAFNGSDGIDFDGANNTIVHVSIHDNGQQGVQCGDDGIVTACQIYNNSANGVNIIGDNNTIISGNQIFDNSQDGVFITANSNSDVTISHNRIRDNSGDGIQVSGTTNP